MDRTSALDSAFLQVEDDLCGLHIASVAVFAGPPPSQAEILACIGRRLPRAPRLRQRLLTVPFGLGLPVWADDPDFDLAAHIRRIGLPAPGDEAVLHEVVDQVLTEHLDLDRPLWEDIVVEGLAGDRWVLVTKVHHTMVDGIAGTDLLTTILDTAPDPGTAATDDVWAPAPLPGQVSLVTDAIRSQASLRLRELRSAPRALGSTLRHPRRAADSVRRLGRGLLGFAGAITPTTASSLTGRLGRDRSYRWAELDLGDVLAVHQQLGGTINDLVLSVVSSAFRDLLQVRGEQPDPHTVRCLVPVSVRSTDSRGVFDNRVSALLATLPVELEDPHDRLVETSVRLRSLKRSEEAHAGEWVAGLADALPPAALTAFLHLAFRSPHRNLTTVVTNVPGPTAPLFLAGRRMLAAYPYVPIADRLRIGVAVTSYDDLLLFGVTFDRDSTPEVDVDVFVRGLETGFAALQQVASAVPTPQEAAR